MKFIVIGAGPAGIASVASLLQQNYNNIIWIDPKFMCGQYQFFYSIPANTRAVGLSAYANYLKIFSAYSNQIDLKVDTFDHYDPLIQVNLDDLKLSMQRQTQIIKQKFSDRVKLIQSTVKQVIETQFHFIVTTMNNQIFEADKVFLCIGGTPKKMPHHLPQIKRIQLYDALSPVFLNKMDLRQEILEVHGSCHSALLALKNLTEMKHPPKKIYHFLNKKLIFAEYIDDFIRHNYTGLKGLTKQFGLKYEQGQYSNLIQTHFQYIPCPSTRIIQAIGYNPRKINFISKQGNKQYSSQNGQLYSNKRLIPNLFLIGLVCPQIVTDKQGETMKAIGVYIFQEYVLNLIRSWNSSQKL